MVNEDDIKKTLLNLSDSFEKETLNTHGNKINDLLKKTNLTDPESFFFLNGPYENQKIYRATIKEKLKKINKTTGPYFIAIYLNYSDLESYLSNIFKTKLGYTCSTDKAHRVIKACLNKEFNGQGSIRFKTDKKSFSDPFYRRFNDWHELVTTCPIINSSKAIEHSKILNKVISNIDRA